MIAIGVGDATHATAFLGGCVKYFQLARRQIIERGGDATASGGHLPDVRCMANTLVKTATQLGFSAAKAAGGRLVATIDGVGARRDNLSEADLAVLISYAEQLLSTFIDESKARRCFALQPEDELYFATAEPAFGHDVDTKFPRLAEDIECAGKCIALSQPTAAVFHLMRAMEGAVGALCAALGILHTERPWGMLLTDLNTAIKAMPAGEGRNAWSAASANLYHVKQAWRNDTMHPKQTYTPEQAREVYAATKTFMAHLAVLV